MDFKKDLANTSWPIVILLVLITVGVIFGIYWWQKKITEEEIISPAITSPSQIEDKTANWKVLKREEYNYQLKYPSDWTYEEERIEGTSRVRLVFKDSSGEEKMTIENPMPQIGGPPNAERIRTEKIKIKESDKYFQKEILRIPPVEENDKETYLAHVVWGKGENEEPSEESGELIFYLDSANDPTEKTLDEILGTFRFLEK